MTYIPGQRQNYVPETITADLPPRGSRRANSDQQPGGKAGGDLAGYYPNPTFKEDILTAAVTLAKIRAHTFLHL